MARSVGLGGICLAVLLAVSPVGAGAAENAARSYLYMGTRDAPQWTQAKAKGIYGWRLDADKGAVTPLGLVAEGSNLYSLGVGPKGAMLLTANRGVGQGAQNASLFAYAVDPATGKLRLADRIEAKLGGAVQVAPHPGGRIVVTVGGATVVAYPIEPRGKLGEPFFTDRHPDSEATVKHGTHRLGAMVHGAEFSPDGRFLYVAEQGLDRIYVYRVDAARRSIQPFDPPYVSVDAGGGPRRVKVHPNGRFLYVDHEQSSTVKAFRIEAGKPVEIQSLSTIPPGWTQAEVTANANSELQVEGSGRYLYVANRGSRFDNIAGYRIDQASGMLTVIDYTPVKGRPLNIAVDTSGRYLFSSNEGGANTLTGFRIDPATGRLTPAITIATEASPGEVRFVPAP